MLWCMITLFIHMDCKVMGLTSNSNNHIQLLAGARQSLLHTINFHPFSHKDRWLDGSDGLFELECQMMAAIEPLKSVAICPCIALAFVQPCTSTSLIRVGVSWSHVNQVLQSPSESALTSFLYICYLELDCRSLGLDLPSHSHLLVPLASSAVFGLQWCFSNLLCMVMNAQLLHLTNKPRNYSSVSPGP